MRYSSTPALILTSILIFTNTHNILVTATTNRTIDDQLGDSITKAQVVYSPTDFNGNPVWRGSDDCAVCAITPEDSKTFDGTWTSATYFADQGIGNISIGFEFQGIAIYIYIIQSNVPAETSEVSSTFCDFYIDHKKVGNYSHVTDGSSTFQYDVLAYRNTSLKDGNHTFLIDATGQINSYTIFDYAVYTTNQIDTGSTNITTSSSSSSPSTTFNSHTPTTSTVTASASTGTSHPSNGAITHTHTHKNEAAIIGGVIGGLAGLSIIFLLCRRHRHHRDDSDAMLEKPTAFDLGLMDSDSASGSARRARFERDGKGKGRAGSEGHVPLVRPVTMPYQSKRRRQGVSSTTDSSLSPPSSSPLISTGTNTTNAEPSPSLSPITITISDSQPSPVRTFIHSDSGVRMDSNSQVIEIPPAYIAD